jgi:hypothetical protein
VDELDTYVFSMEPRQVDRQHAYFSGVVWVDDQELAIVKSYGKWVSELGDVKSPKLPFVTFETYRQPVGDDWFPAYSRSDDQVTTKDAIIPIRLIIRWIDRWQRDFARRRRAPTLSCTDRPHHTSRRIPQRI